jgi:hypothetical protein
VQLPADGQDTEWIETPGFAFAPAGSGASIPTDHTPADSVSKSPREWLDPSVYVPTPVQFPAEAHDTELNDGFGLVPASPGRVTSVPAPQFRSDDAHPADGVKANTTPQATIAR